MTRLPDYNQKSTVSRWERHAYQSRDSLVYAGRYLSEIPTRIGLALIGSRLLGGVLIASALLFIGFVFSSPVFDYRVDARLSDHYSDVSPAVNDILGVPEMADIIETARFTDIAQTDDRIFVATYGHGVQSYDRENYLWHTFDARSADFQIDNDINDIHYQTSTDTERLWTVGLDGEISLGEFMGRGDVSFQSLYGRSAWRYITEDQITTANMIDAYHVVFGTSGKGAGVYNVHKHTWQDLPEVSNLSVRKIQYLAEQHRLWLLTNRGIRVYAVIPGQADWQLTFKYLPELELVTDNLVGMKVFPNNTAIGLTADLGCYVFHDRWSGKLLGGPAIAGLNHDSIQYTAYWNSLFVVVGSEFGIAAYDQNTRNWQALVSGNQFPDATDFDHDADRLLVATTNGVFVVGHKSVTHVLAGSSIKQVSLGSNGFLFVTAGGYADQLVVHWSNFSGNEQRLLVGNSKPDISNPTIFDVVVVDGDEY